METENTPKAMSLEEIKAEISKWQAMANKAYRFELRSEHPDIGAKELAWGKLDAYRHCLQLLNNLKQP